MVSESATRIIDAEFATYGPVAFDLGLFMGNMLLSYFSQPGYEARRGDRPQYEKWILSQIEDFWTAFVSRFDDLWCSSRSGDAYPCAFFGQATENSAFTDARRCWFEKLLRDALSYSGAEIIRRITGFAHVDDFEQIENTDVRGILEGRALDLARTLIVSPDQIKDIDALIVRCRALSCTTPRSAISRFNPQ